MKWSFVTVLSTLALLATSVNAQATYIGSPLAGTVVHRAQDLVVQVVRPIGLQGSQEVGLAIALLSCPEPTSCAQPQQQLGTVLYTGPYNPQRHEIPEPYQNFTVTVPDADYYQGRAQLSVVRFHIIGAGPSPNLEFHNLTLTVA